jgi:Fe-S oxidoreductase
VAEEKRVFEICNGCRLCWNLCPSFPTLFAAVDALDSPMDAAPTEPAADGHHAAAPRADILGQAEALEKIPASVHQKVVDLCWQCKLCEPICPYVPPHEFAVDFPRLMLRHKAVDARQRGVSLSDRILGDPDLVGRIGTMLPVVANAANASKANRVVMEAVLGIHRDRKLPDFAAETFLAWARRRKPKELPADAPRVVLFYTCSVQWNEPRVGRCAVEVLEHNGIRVEIPELRCCGMPALDGGDVARAADAARHDVSILRPYVEAGCDVVSPGPTCSFMMKREWPDYLGSSEARAVAARAFDLMEYLWKLRKEGRLREDFTHEVGEVGYHVPCHLKVQKIGFRSRDILKKLPGAQVTMVDQCSCMDGTWGMKTGNYATSKERAGKLLDGLGEAPTLSSDCLIAKLQIEEGKGRPVVHPIELVWKAYFGETT